MNTIRRLVAVTTILVMVAAGCGDGDEAATVETDSLSVSVLPALSFAPYYIAESRGYFAEENLDIEFVASQRGVDTIPLLIQGDLDVWNGAINAAFLNAAAAGEPVRVVADKGSLPAGACSYVAFVGPPEILDSDGKVDTSKILAERTAVGGSMTSGYALTNFLASMGIEEGDITTVTMGMGDRAAAVQSGQVAMSFIAEPSITRMVNEGMVLVSEGGEHSPGLPMAVVGFGPNLLTERPGVAERFMRAYLRGVADYQKGTTSENLAILSAATDVEISVLQEACWPAISADGSVDTDVLADVQGWAVDNGQIESVVPVGDYYDPTFAEAAFASLSAG